MDPKRNSRRHSCSRLMPRMPVAPRPSGSRISPPKIIPNKLKVLDTAESHQPVLGAEPADRCTRDCQARQRRESVGFGEKRFSHPTRRPPNTLVKIPLATITMNAVGKKNNNHMVHGVVAPRAAHAGSSTLFGQLPSVFPKAASAKSW